MFGVVKCQREFFLIREYVLITNDLKVIYIASYDILKYTVIMKDILNNYRKKIPIVLKNIYIGGQLQWLCTWNQYIHNTFYKFMEYLF